MEELEEFNIVCSIPMKLSEIIRNLDSWNPNCMIYSVEPWTNDSPAIMIWYREDLPLVIEISGNKFQYLLEVFTAIDVLNNLETSSGLPSDQERIDRVIEYAVNDA